MVKPWINVNGVVLLIAISSLLMRSVYPIKNKNVIGEILCSGFVLLNTYCISTYFVFPQNF